MATRLVFSRKDSALVDQRHEARHRVECVRATVSGDLEPPFNAVLDDISTFGCRLKEIDDVDVGQRLWLRLPGSGPVVAVAVWAEGGRAGCRFDTPISQSLMRALLPGT